ncbi:MAG TPA: MarR family transcriptional regulator [Clostridiaceae bacterium]|nr:MarR family transcriptional regulator [Clostridiaceae bacterium]
MNNLSTECFLRVLQLHRKIQHNVKKNLAELGFAWNQYSILKSINPGETLTLSEISARAVKVNSNVTSLVDFLEEKGIVMRINDPDDRRVIRVKLTDEGVKVRKETIEKHEAFVNTLFSQIEDNEKKLFIEAADAILKGVEQVLDCDINSLPTLH